MAEHALYRKYRSQDFSQVIGQDHVVKTLMSALASGRLSHAYLFTGPRGVGKTSVARLLARALNCTGEPKPCNACTNCLAAINSSLDVIEMDAASNRSIDAIRDLREKVNLAPTQGQYKVYIIDEVHMLTTEAFNALLKTLEEPPTHVVFILATTEAHKVPETIISRTQRFNFRPHTETNIAAHLQSIAEAEGIKAEPEALALIASSARGGFRDAIGLLDQLGASSTSPLTEASVRELLGYSSSEEIATLSAALADHQAAVAVTVLNRLEASGAQASQIALQLIEQWRRILGASLGARPASDEQVAKLSQTVPPNRSASIMEALLEVPRSPWPQLALEAVVVKLAAEDGAAAHSSATRPRSGEAKTRKQATAAPAATTDTTATLGAPAMPAESAPATQGTTGQLPAALWPKVLVLLKSQNNSLCALLQMYPVDFGDGEITIKPRFNFHRDLFLKPQNRTMIEAAATRVYGRPVKISARTEETTGPGKRTKPDPSAELVSSALEILGGEIVE